jgi:heme/copper-type cytochrome/quinol oxidase subunit 1
MVRFAWAFPVGLFDLLIPSLFVRGYTAAAIVGWLFYVGLTISCLRQERRARYFTIYAILCACLLLNVAGCQTELRRPWKM